jgi:hypothetical protein
MRLKIIKVLVLIVFVNLLTFNSPLKAGQDLLDSNYIAFLRIKGLVGSEYDSYITDTKCGFRVVNSVKSNLNQYTLDKRERIQSVLQRPTTQKTLITPSGKFKIHYDTTGFHAIKYSVHELAKAIDSAYNFEVNIMGFPSAPQDLGAGGDNLYDIYIQNITPLYGYTKFETLIGPDRYTSFMVIDNSFDEDTYFTKGINAARVTAAHEYHHAIQIGNYRYSEKDTWFYELTSTSMEEFVFDSINDYYAYIPNFFNRPDKIFTGFDGYSQAIWNIYLHKIFNQDFSLFVRQWELIRTFPALEAIKKSIEERGRSFKTVFSQFYLYNYYTGYRSIPDKYYEEGAHYPLIRFNYPVQFIQPIRTINGNSQPCAANYYLVIDSVSNIPFPPDSIAIILVNTNIDSALAWSNYSRPFPYSVKITSEQSDAAFKKISKNLFSKIETNDPANWNDYYVVNDTATIIIVQNSKELAFPMPANLNKHSFVNIPVPNVIGSQVDLFIYSVGMDLIHHSSKVPQVYDNKVVVQWDGRDLNNNKVASGIYFYILTNEEIKSIGKIVIINE